MISSTAMPLSLESLGDSLAAAVAQGQGEGFLESLLGALPPELEGLSPEELLEWLQNQEPQALSFAPVPLQAQPRPEPAAARLPENPEALLGLMLSSRGGLPQGIGQGEAGRAGALGELVLSARSGEAVGDTALQPFQSFLQTAGSIGATTTTARQPAGVDLPSFTLSTPVTDPGFAQAVGERLVWMVRQDLQQARLHLDPVELGPLEITMSIKDDVASVVIHAHHATTRDVLEGDTQRLRTLLGESGFSSVDVNVARDGGRQPDGQGGRPAPFSLFGGKAEPEAEGEVQGQVSLAGRGLVDHYA